jgi:hypothetical protein
VSHICPQCGLEHDFEAAVVETEVAGEAAVEIATIEADRDIALARIAAKAEETEDQRRIAGLEGEMRGMREMLERLMPPEPEPEPEPVPVVVQADPEPVVDDQGATPPPIVEPLPSRKASKSAWWG